MIVSTRFTFEKKILVIFAIQLVIASAKMTEMSMVETLQLWNEAVSLTEKGHFEDSLMKFMSLEQRTDSGQAMITSARNLFNIGQTYFSLGRIDMAIEAFKESIGKDKMLAVAHFMLGCAHLKKNLNRDALKNFEDAYFFLRGNRLIDYKQLGLKYKLYGCEILCNKAIAYAKLGKVQQARNDFLKAMESRAEPHHGVIEDALLCFQTGKIMVPTVLPSHAVFQPSRSKVLAAKEKPNYLGKSQVVAARDKDENFNDPPQKPLFLTRDSESSGMNKRDIGQEAHQPQAITLVNERSNLMKDLRKKETRKSLKKTSGAPARPLPSLPQKNNGSATLSPYSSDNPPPRPTSPHPRRKDLDQNSSRSELNLPPSKPLPPSPRSKSPVPVPQRPLPPSPARPDSPVDNAIPKRPPKRQGMVTFQLVITRTVQVNRDSTPSQLSRTAAEALGVSEDKFALWYKRDDELTSVTDETLSFMWNSAPDLKPTIYCYEK